jgi:hypothetical protein
MTANPPARNVSSSSGAATGSTRTCSRPAIAWNTSASACCVPNSGASATGLRCAVVKLTRGTGCSSRSASASHISNASSPSMIASGSPSARAVAAACCSSQHASSSRPTITVKSCGVGVAMCSVRATSRPTTESAAGSRRGNGAHRAASAISAADAP